ncbi:hypothetical protein AX769_02025 [Frondihabitans sp. PAMC 28766]|uniref:hypothetical protein n=1 Tax=Frondihabitans sp. PAMC 28766 TaxID=1795630 RepID=UPI00078C67CA|nr:hypothetical protein [Frondihabitans sp. PAMC 28766]AMM19133.1 hypothetical protein AX769_02025 [Frondihabitans sp. PAMC 28766]
MTDDTLPPELALRAFSVREARSRGVPDRALRRVALTRPHHGVRALAAVETLSDPFEGRCRSLLPALPVGAVFSHSTAARLWGLPVPAALQRADAELHVTVTRHNAVRRKGVRGHVSVSPPSSTMLRGMPLTAPIETWAECRTVLGLDDLVILGDALTGRWSKTSRASELALDDLRAAAAKTTGRGVARLRDAAVLMRAGSRSPQETRLRLAIVRAGLPEPLMNVDEYDGAGLWLGFVDFSYRQQRLVLEYEGDHHRVDRKTFLNDIARRERFADAGWRTLRVTSRDLTPSTLPLFIARLARHLSTRVDRDLTNDVF